MRVSRQPVSVLVLVCVGVGMTQACNNFSPGSKGDSGAVDLAADRVGTAGAGVGGRLGSTGGAGTTGESGGTPGTAGMPQTGGNGGSVPNDGGIDLAVGGTGGQLGCFAGATRCEGAQPQTCDDTGVFKNVGSACPNVCDAASGTCSGACAPGAKTCNGLQPQSCDATGAWQNVGTLCKFVCAAATATCTGSCMPGAKQCMGLQPQVCDDTGVFKNAGSACVNICSPNSGSCGGLCQPGAKQCTGAVPQTCDSLGAWQDGAPCGVCTTCAGTTGTCTPVTGTVCDDNNKCTTGEKCQAGVCGGGTAVACSAPDQCHTQAACLPATGCPAPANKTGSCDDNNKCTTGETCQGGVCGGGTVVTCAAPDQCHTQGACVPATGCPAPGNKTGSCTDTSDKCNTGKTCQSGICAGGTPVSCPAPVACYTQGSCVKASGCPAATPAPDGTACGGGTCINRACCVDNNNACSGKTCGTVLNNCSHSITCQPNSCATYTTCQSNQCACPTGSRPLDCNSAASPACGLWSFETPGSGWSEGWVISVSQAATTDLTLNTTYHSNGTHSASVGFDSSGVFLEMKVPICTTNLLGATISVHLHFVGAAGTTGYGFFLRLYTDSTSIAHVDPVLDADVIMTGTVTDSSTSSIMVHMDTADSGAWTGTVYMDEIRIQ